MNETSGFARWEGVCSSTQNLKPLTFNSSVIACHIYAGIIGGECAAALAGGINMMLWHDVTAGICQLQVRTYCDSHLNDQCKSLGLQTSIENRLRAGFNTCLPPQTLAWVVHGNQAKHGVCTCKLVLFFCLCHASFGPIFAAVVCVKTKAQL